MSDLKPCPFCNGAAEQKDELGRQYARCKTCLFIPWLFLDVWNSRTQPEATAPAPIPGLPFADLATPIKEFEARKAAALASSANALSTGDRVDALEEAAQVCDQQADGTNGAYRTACLQCANAVRELRDATIRQKKNPHG